MLSVDSCSVLVLGLNVHVNRGQHTGEWFFLTGSVSVTTWLTVCS